MPRHIAKSSLLHRLAQFFARSASVPRFLVAILASLFIRYGLMERAAQSSAMPQGVRPLDLRFAYGSAQVRELFSQLGPEGVAAYARFLLSYDVLYPISYLLMIGWALALLARKRPSRLILCAPAIALFDLLENLTIVTMAQIYPRHSDALAIAASVFTSAKWIMVAFTLGAMAWLAFKRLRGSDLAPD